MVRQAQVKVNVEIPAALARVVSPNLDIDARGESPDPRAMLLAELADFVTRHRPCRQLSGDATRVVDINALRALAPLPCALAPRPSRPQPRTRQPRWSRRHSAH
jgi:hypothetical protein